MDDNVLEWKINNFIKGKEQNTEKEYPIDTNKPWYHGSNNEFDVLCEGSPITECKNSHDNI
jgi:hypothetical protein